MKKLFLLLSYLILFSACSSEDEQNSYTFRNSTNVDVIVKPFENLLDGAPMFYFEIPAGETKTYKTDYQYSIFDIDSDVSNLNFSYNFQGDTRVIYGFQKKVMYKITGTSNSANLTYVNSSGNTIQTTVSVPHTIGFDSFSGNFKYISAQSNNSSGSIRVEYFYEDSLVDSGFCESAYCIATASN